METTSRLPPAPAVSSSEADTARSDPSTTATVKPKPPETTTSRQPQPKSDAPTSFIGPDAEQTEETLRTGRLVRVRPLHSRSHALRLDFSDGTRALFKPFLRGNTTARYEVAYYRMARFLSVEVVPISVIRQFYPARLTDPLQNTHLETVAAFLEAVEREPDGQVVGAVIEWLDEINPDDEIRFPTHRGDMLERMAQAPHSSLSVAFARMVVADYLLGNWDRFSGGNLFRHPDGVRLALIDHNGSFVTFLEERRQRMQENLAMLACEPATLMERIRKLDGKTILRIINRKDEDPPLIGNREKRNTLQRRRELLTFFQNARLPACVNEP